MAVSPQFAVTPRLSIVQASGANTATDGTGTLATLITAGFSGTKIYEVLVDAASTTTAGMVRLFVNDGTNNRLFDEFNVSATTASSTVPTFRTSKSYSNLVLPSGYGLRASTHNAETFNVYAFGADL